jgi:hypothetical protein
MTSSARFSFKNSWNRESSSSSSACALCARDGFKCGLLHRADFNDAGELSGK